MLIFFSSCCTELYFDEDETFWTDIYKENDNLIFQSQTNKMRFDTIQILLKTDYTPKGDCNFLVSKYDREGSVVESRYIHNGYTSDSDLFIQHFKEERGQSLPTLRVYGTEVHRYVLKDTVLQTKNLGRLSDCFTFSNRNTYNGYSKFEIKTFVWSKKYGLVMFVGENGEKYELIKKTRV